MRGTEMWHFRNPFGVEWVHGVGFTQGSRCAATLGFAA